MPDSGNVLIVFGPHVAISGDGEVGKYLRCGQCAHSTSCGAVIGAFNYCVACDSKEQAGMVDSVKNQHDMQMDYVKRYMMAHFERIATEPSPLAALALQAYEMVKEGVEEIVNTDFGSGYLALVGGVQINMPEPYEDHFLPLLFEVRRSGEAPKDMISHFR